MARTHGRLLTRIWQDSDFRHASAGAQRVYMLLLSQPNLGHSGVISLTVRRWAALCGDTDATSIETALQELHERRFIVIDWDTEEIFVRTLVKNDAIYKQPQLWPPLAGEVAGVLSTQVRCAIAAELRTLPDLDTKIKPIVEDILEMCPQGLPEGYEEGSPKGSSYPSVDPLQDPYRDPYRARARAAPTPSPTPSPESLVESLDLLTNEDQDPPRDQKHDERLAPGQAARSARDFAKLSTGNAWTDRACASAVAEAAARRPDQPLTRIQDAFVVAATWRSTFAPARFVSVVDQALRELDLDPELNGDHRPRDGPIRSRKTKTARQS